MKKLTNKEREIMDLYWQHGPMFVRELQEHYADPKPHFNTLSTPRSPISTPFPPKKNEVYLFRMDSSG